MTKLMKELGIDRLSPPERIALAMEIWESLERQIPSPEITPEQRLQLQQRDRELTNNPEIALTWDEIRAHVEDHP
ncbi:addiction module protein [Tuwongella immobilis]|uniref:: Unstab_antitox n=1 Tax=Tuwongella immobilis TaxID=692036 RepID=A0A6C2YIT3_9BACT|nr:addiction module protein [Tuwongella immobilis]VIP01159.1 : Unstab_antitox [Tuwongella immobilis]VTR97744.1 : Unstab_antitox [Tuwongella immobilis]